VLGGAARAHTVVRRALLRSWKALGGSNVAPLSTMMVVFGALNGLGFLLIGEACAVTSQRSYVGAWRETIGQGTSFILAVTLPQREVILLDFSEVTCGLRYLGRPGAVGGVPRVVWGQKNMENNSVTLNHYVHTEYASCEQRFHSTVTAVTRDKACTGQVGPTAPDAARDRPDRSPIAPRTRAAGAGAAAQRRRCTAAALA
jgi:hypothetical protein